MQGSFNCSQCQTSIEVEARAAGQEIACPQCHAALTVPALQPGPGVTIHGFRIKELLARGGMGEVFLAEQLSLKRDVALKVLPGQLATDQEAVEQFLTELRVASQLDHPYIVFAMEGGVDDGVYYLTMPYVQGPSLEERVIHAGALTESEGLDLAGRVAEALAWAWDKHKIIHCDIKPANILIDIAGNPRLLDLGLSRIARGQKSPADDSITGTPNYMSPEQVECLPSVDFRSDMYSLGVTLYFAWTAQLPFQAPTPREVLHRHATEQLPDPRQFNHALSPHCVMLLEAMLAQNPEHRYPTWHAFLDEVFRASFLKG